CSGFRLRIRCGIPTWSWICSYPETRQTALPDEHGEVLAGVWRGGNGNAHRRHDSGRARGARRRSAGDRRNVSRRGGVNPESRRGSARSAIPHWAGIPQRPETNRTDTGHFVSQILIALRGERNGGYESKPPRLSF